MNDLEIIVAMLKRAGIKSSLVLYDVEGVDYIAIFVEHGEDEVSEFDFTIGGALTEINPRGKAARAWPETNHDPKRYA